MTADDDIVKFLSDTLRYAQNNSKEDVVIMLMSDHGNKNYKFLHSDEG